MKKQITALVLATALVLSLASCSGSKNGSSAKSTGKGSTDSVTDLTWTVWDGGDTLKVYQKICDDFHAKNPDIQVKVVSIPDEYDTKLTAMVASNQAPDIAQMESATLLYPMADEGKIVNLLDLMKKDSSFSADSLIPQIKYMKDSSFMAGYGVGAELMTMFYNPSLFKKAGIAEPPANYADAWDWDTFVKNAKLLTIDKNGKNATQPDFDSQNIKQYGVNISQWWAYWGSFIASANGDYLTQDGKKLALTDPQTLDALQKLVDLIYVDHVCPTPASGKSLPGISETITTGKVAMSIAGQWSNFDLINDDVSSYNVAALPKIGSKAKTMITASALSIFKGKHVDEAWKFFKYIYAKGSTLPLEKSGLWMPTVKAMYNANNESTWIGNKFPSNYKEAIADPMANGTAVAPYTSYVVNFSKINDIISPALDNAWLGKASVKDSLNRVLSQANAEVQGRRDK